MDFSTKASEFYLREMNESLLMEILAAGSGDCLPLIFNCLTSLKDKVRLERVCKTFRKHACSFAAWSNVTNLIIKDEREKHLINGEYISTVHLESAITAIVVRIRNIKVIDLYMCAQPIAYSSVASTIMQRGVRSYRNVKELSLIGHNLEAYSQSIFQLVAIFESQLQTLTLSAIRFTDSDDKICLWNHIGNCSNLKELIYQQPVNEENEKHVLDTIKTALRGKSIESLKILVTGIETDDLIEIISSLSDHHPLRYLECHDYCQSLIDLAHCLPAVHRNGLHHIVYQNLDDSDSFWSNILNLPRQFSQLTVLVLFFLSFNFTQDEAVTLIVSYLSILKEESSQRSKYFKLTLINFVLGKPSWINVFAVLVEEHSCKIDLIADGTFLIRFDRKERACIELCIGSLW